MKTTNIKPIFQNGNIIIKSCKHGYFAYNQFDTTVGKCLDQYGEWCDEELDFFREILNPGDVILDIGAYIGTHTVFFAKKVGSLGKVLAFEPQRLSFQMLCTNLTLNAIYNTECLQVGVSHKEGTVKLPVFDPYIGGNYGAIPIEGYEQGSNLSLITIDSLKLERCNHMKIDVEGMESKVIEGARRTIKTFRPTLYVENNTVEKSKDILQILLDLEYDCWWHFVPYFNPKNFFNCKEDIFARHVRQIECNLVCFPKEDKVQPQRLVPVEGVEDDWSKALKRR